MHPPHRYLLHPPHRHLLHLLLLLLLLLLRCNPVILHFTTVQLTALLLQFDTMAAACPPAQAQPLQHTMHVNSGY
jgi:hypothetical protein